MLLSQIGSGDMSVALAGGGATANGGHDEAAAVPSARLLAAFPGLVLKGLNGAGGADASGADAAVAGMRGEIASEMGSASLLDVACVIGMFNGINRVADMCGIKMDALSAPFAGFVLDVLRMEGGSNWGGPAAGSKL